MPDMPTTLIGLLAFAAALIISDWVKHRGRVKVDDTKINELSKQTNLLVQLCESTEATRRHNKKIWKRLRKMSKRVDALHAKAFPDKA